MQNKESKKESLLNCPFCGREAKISGYYFIQCTKCGTSTLTHTNREEAIKTWNTRKPIQEIVERLEEECKAYRNSDWLLRDKAIKVGTMTTAMDIVKEVGGIDV